jgi:hypothetical protein
MSISLISSLAGIIMSPGVIYTSEFKLIALIFLVSLFMVLTTISTDPKTTTIKGGY